MRDGINVERWTFISVVSGTGISKIVKKGQQSPRLHFPPIKIVQGLIFAHQTIQKGSKTKFSDNFLNVCAANISDFLWSGRGEAASVAKTILFRQPSSLVSFSSLRFLPVKTFLHQKTFRTPQSLVFWCWLNQSLQIIAFLVYILLRHHLRWQMQLVRFFHCCKSPSSVNGGFLISIFFSTFTFFSLSLSLLKWKLDFSFHFSLTFLADKTRWVEIVGAFEKVIERLGVFCMVRDI